MQFGNLGPPAPSPLGGLDRQTNTHTGKLTAGHQGQTPAPRSFPERSRRGEEAEGKGAAGAARDEERKEE